MKNPRAALLAASILLATSRAHAQPQVQTQTRLAVLPMSGVNVHPGYLEAARDIFKDHLMGTGRFYVIGVPGLPPDHEYSAQEAIALGRSVQAELAAVSHLVHLSGTARIRITMFRTSDGSVAHSDSMTTAGGPDDLDPVLKRLAVGFATGKPVNQTAEIDSVTQKEADPYLKQMATRVFGVRLGAVVPLARPSGSVTPATGLGIFWLYDAREFMAEVFGDFYTSSGSNSASIFDFGIGGYYPFSRKNITPYIGGGGAWSVSSLGGAGGTGLRLHGAAGALIGRLWSVQCRADLGYFVNLFGEKNQVYGYGQTTQTNVASTRNVYSHGPMLTLGLGF
jgi:hypothetical protein